MPAKLPVSLLAISLHELSSTLGEGRLFSDVAAYGHPCSCLESFLIHAPVRNLVNLVLFFGVACQCPTSSEEMSVQTSPGKATTEIHPDVSQACAFMVGKPDHHWGELPGVGVSV